MKDYAKMAFEVFQLIREEDISEGTALGRVIEHYDLSFSEAEELLKRIL